MSISVVIPVLNEEDNLVRLYKELVKVLPTISKRYEVIFVDNGSTDGSIFVLQEFAKDKNVKLVLLKAHSKSLALAKGFKIATGEIIIQMDADMQDNPSYIPIFIETLKKGYDLVVGWRQQRKDTRVRILMSGVFNLFVNLVSNIKLHDHNCGLKVYTRDTAKSLVLRDGLHRYITLIAQKKGFSMTEVKIQHRKRFSGRSKYGLGRIYEAGLDYLKFIDS